MASSTVFALATPTDEPMLAGFTNTGRPSCCTACATRDASARSSSRNATNRGWAMPSAANTRLVVALSIDTALPSTPEPTYATWARSSRPCTVPSSPIGPCNNGNTTVALASCELAAITSPSDDARPVASSRSGSASRPRAKAAIAESASIHCPAREMAMVVTS